jgi:DNA-binding NarL/FixJ family response regulator
MTEPATLTRPLRVLIVEPDECIRESLAGILRIGGRCAVVGVAGGADEAIALAATIQPDAVLLDPRLPIGSGGRAIVAALREVAPAVRIIVLRTGAGGEPSPAGIDWDPHADAYIKKTFRPHELIDAVLSAARSTVA